MIRISTVIITYNEEKNIADCIDSVLAISDEVIVVDSFSTDKTEVICLAKGVKFVKNKYEGMIEQKNYAVSLATHNYILSLDADERLSDTLTDSILKVKQKWEADGFSFNRFNHYCGSWIYHSGWYPDRKLRLFDRRKGRFQGVNPHDEFKLDSGSIHKYLKGDLLHYTFESVEDHRNRLIKYANTAAEHYYKIGRPANHLLLIIKPAFTFLKKYFIQLGFLDGYNGFVISKMSAEYVYLRTRRLLLLKKDNNS